MSSNPLDSPKPAASWQERLAEIVEMSREMSLQTDPQAMVRQYGARARRLIHTDATVSLSRRDLEPPQYRITRSWLWKEEINPWLQKDRLPLLDHGFLGELIHGNEPRLILDFHVDPNDPAAEHLTGFRSLAFIPMYDRGEAVNAVVQLSRRPNGFDPERWPEAVWTTNLFGRATHNLVLRDEAERAYNAVDREMRMVADIQRSLLPAQLPRIPTLDLAVYYQTARRAGGDYYDFFPLPENRWGILIADVSGHGTPAAVVMAVTHSIAHAHPGPPTPPGKMLAFLNKKLTLRQGSGPVSFVTAFYGVYDPATRSLAYCSAGHNPPCLRRAADGRIVELDQAQFLPLGINLGEEFGDAVQKLNPGDQLLFYTDGITEARNPQGEMFGIERLQQTLAATDHDADGILAAVRSALDHFTQGLPADDDQTVLSVRVL